MLTESVGPRNDAGEIAVPRLTLDNNCLIALDHEESAAPDLRRLISAYRAGLVHLCVVAIGASERSRAGVRSLTEFESRLARIGLQNAEILMTPWHLDLSLLGFSTMLVSEEGAALVETLYRALFPTDGDGSYAGFCASHDHVPDDDWHEKWLNRRCDALTLWAHLNNAGDIFITIDSNFHKKTRKPALIALGAKAIMRPAEAVCYLESEVMP